MNHHHLSNGNTTPPDDTLNFFDEQVFAHTDNGTLLAIHPRHINLSQSRTLGSIPAVVKDWMGMDRGYQVTLAVKDRAREIIFRVNLPAEQSPRIVLQKDMMLYMSFSWDKVIEYLSERNPGYVQAAL